MSERICSIDECDRQAQTRGWCARHYSRWVRWGDATFAAPLGKSMETDPRPNRYPVKDLTCRLCGSGFRGRAGLMCFRCRYERQQKPCQCGKPINRRSRTCNKCRPKAGLKAVGDLRARHLSTAGYVLVPMPLDHPSRTARSGLYIREHRLVMESMIGRYLSKGESVHHRNGVKTDNRPENLELWVTSQPAGQRAADLLAWARSIIETYEPIESVLVSSGSDR